MRTKRTWFSGPFAALLLSVALLTGCVPRPSADTATTAAPYPQEEKLPYEQYQENELKEQSRFPNWRNNYSATKSAAVSWIFSICSGIRKISEFHLRKISSPRFPWMPWKKTGKPASS